MLSVLKFLPQIKEDEKIEKAKKLNYEVDFQSDLEDENALFKENINQEQIKQKINDIEN